MFVTGIQIKSFGSGTDAITKDLAQHMSSVEPDQMILVNITMAERIDFKTLNATTKSMDKKARRAYVIQELKAFTTTSQQDVVAELLSLQQNGSVAKIKSYWVANAINCLATPSAIEQLSYMIDIESIDYDETRQLIDPAETKNAYAVDGTAGVQEITWNVTKINADDVWDLGFTGEGVLVAVLDTGVNYDHLDLADHMWENDDFPNHGYDFVNDDNNPKDDHGHGTHCAGTVAGDGTAGSQTGVAPDATIMACKILDSGGSGNESYTWSAVEFTIEHGVDVISFSVGWQHSWGPNRKVWRETFDAVLAAGMVASVAAGNEGQDQGSYPIPDNVRTPGDCPPPWLNPDQTLTGGTSGVICVGSTTSSDAVSGFSSRGPVSWELINPFYDYEYNPEIGLIRPDVAAPGSNIKSLAHYSNTGYESGWSGTSMATPANAGMIALMLQKNNLLTPEQISQTVEETANVLVAGKNNNSGAGRIDALAAVEATSYPGPSYYSHSLNDAAGNNDGMINPGETIMVTLSIANFSEEIVDGVSVELSTESEYVTITQNTAYFGDMSLEDIIEVEDAFTFEVANNIPGGEMVEFIVTASGDTESWESSFTEMAHAVNLEVTGFMVEDPSGNNNGSLDPGETADILVETKNTGQMDALETMAYFSSLSGLVTVNNSSFDLGDLAVGESATATFNVTVDAASPTGISVEFLFEASSGFFTLEKSISAKIGAIVEDFETGDFSKFNWEFDGNQDWIITTQAYEGDYAAKSGNIDNNQTSTIMLTYEVGGNDSIAFMRKVSSESGYDFLRFYIDNSLIEQWSGEVGWERMAYAVEGGSHTFKWEYYKDYIVTSGSDEAWIDNVELPGASDDALTAYAGGDDVVCEDVDYETNGIAQNYTSVLWESSGTGQFEDETSLNTTYSPSNLDYNFGSVTLTLTAYASGVNPVSDDMVLSFASAPGAAGSISGDTEACNGNTMEYEVAAISGSDSYNWELSPEEAGSITGDGNMISIAWEDNYVGEAVLKVQGMNDCGGGAYSEDLVIMVDECSGIGEAGRQEFSISPNPNDGTFVLTIEKDLESGATVRMISLTGTVVYENENLTSGELTIQADGVENGVYFLIIENDNERMIEKIVVQK